MARFKLTTIDNHNNILYYFYDNDTQDIWDQNNKLINLADQSRCKSMIQPRKWGLNQPNYYTKKFPELRIQPGLNCNFHCDYCSNTHLGGETGQFDFKPVQMPPKIAARNLVDMLIKNEIEPEHIVYWGGEPLVYWKYIIELQPLLEQYLPNATFAMCSNGSLLTLDKAKYMVDHFIRLTISHDAWAFKTYRDDDDPFDNPRVVEAVRYLVDNYKERDGSKINVPCISTVISPDNCELTKIPKWFEDKLGFPIATHIESIVFNDRNTINHVKQFDETTTQTFLKEAFKIGTSDQDQKQVGGVRKVVSELMRDLINKIPSSARQYYCRAPFNLQVTVDLQGNVLKCHGSDPAKFTIGHVNNFESIINDTMYSVDDRTHCKDCFVKMVCKGSCPMLEQQDLDCYCKTQSLMGYAVFMSAWKLLFDTLIVKVEQV